MDKRKWIRNVNKMKLSFFESSLFVVDHKACDVLQKEHRRISVFSDRLKEVSTTGSKTQTKWLYSFSRCRSTNILDTRNDRIKDHQEKSADSSYKTTKHTLVFVV